MSENDKDNKINFDEDFKKLLDEIKDEAVTFFNKKEKTEEDGADEDKKTKPRSRRKKAEPEKKGAIVPADTMLPLNFRLFRFRDALFFRGFLRRL